MNHVRFLSTPVANGSSRRRSCAILTAALAAALHAVVPVRGSSFASGAVPGAVVQVNLPAGSRCSAGAATLVGESNTAAGSAHAAGRETISAS